MEILYLVCIENNKGILVPYRMFNSAHKEALICAVTLWTEYKNNGNPVTVKLYEQTVKDGIPEINLIETIEWDTPLRAVDQFIKVMDL